MASQIPTDPRAALTTLLASATQAYALKNYPAAANLYSQASTLQASLNGEMDPSNADLLYAYGRCLYHVAVSQSDVLGGRVAAEKKKGKGKKMNGTMDVDQEPASVSVGGAMKDQNGLGSNKPYFQISGDDEGWESSDEEDEGSDDATEQTDEAAEEGEDDFATAYEILDVARVLFLRKLEGLAGAGKGQVEKEDDVRQIKDRLADTHDLQGEISLENERFADAVTDSRASLVLKQEIYPKESSLIAEAHFKLSLALEFASVTTEKKADGEPVESKEAQIDEAMRKEAAEHMVAAISSSKLRIEQETKAMSNLDLEAAAEKKKELEDVKEIIQDMEQRLEELHNPVVSLNGITNSTGVPDGSNSLGGILGSLLGESAADQKARIEEVTKGANDLTGLIRHKKKSQVSDAPVKRKVEAVDDDDGDEDELSGPVKKIKAD